MNEAEARRIMRAERLGELTVWFEPIRGRTERVGIDRDREGWVVFATNERAAVEGAAHYSDESSALDAFIHRARAARSMTDRRKEFGSALFRPPRE